MSKIEELIKEKCPNGVEYKPLNYITNLTAGERVTKANMNSQGQYFVYGGGKLPTGKYDDYNSENCLIISRAGSAGFVNWINDKFWATDVCFVSSQKLKKVNIKFVYYYVKNMQVDLQSHIYGGNLPKLDKNYLWNLKIPIPPIDVQEEIVRILDKFSELEEELEAELEDRKKQYEFWCVKLLKSNSEIKKLKDVANVIDSLHATPKYINDGYPMIRVADVKFGIVDTTNALKVSEEDYYRFISKYKPRENDIIISRVGSFGNLCIVGTEEICLGQNTTIIHPNINAKYLYYYLLSNNVQEWIKDNVNGAGYKSLSLANISEIPIIVPSLVEQERIVNILDKFEKLINDISEGLPAEIELRRKQYEYYRNKLLSFETIKYEQ